MREANINSLLACHTCFTWYVYKLITYFVLQVLWESANRLICISDLNKCGTQQTGAAPVEVLCLAVPQKLTLEKGLKMFYCLKVFKETAAGPISP